MVEEPTVLYRRTPIWKRFFALERRERDQPDPRRAPGDGGRGGRRRRAHPAGRPVVTEPPAARRRAAAVAGHTGDRETAPGGLARRRPGRAGRPDSAPWNRSARSTPTTLRSALQDESALVRRRAAGAGCPSSGRLVAGGPGRSRRGRGEMAAFACGEQGASVGADVLASSSDLATATRTPSSARPRSPRSARSATPPRCPAILAATGGDKAAVRRRAVLALAPVRRAGGRGHAANARSTDRDWQVRQAAEDLLGS